MKLLVILLFFFKLKKKNIRKNNYDISNEFSISEINHSYI